MLNVENIAKWFVTIYYVTYRELKTSVQGSVMLSLAVLFFFEASRQTGWTKAICILGSIIWVLSAVATRVHERHMMRQMVEALGFTPDDPKDIVANATKDDPPSEKR